MAIVKPEYWVTLSGKQHPTYPGVLLAAREEGMLGLEVTVLQYPSPENGDSAVCLALVTMRGPDGRELVFQDVGDANPKNVNSRIAPHIIRMASTRAKGRALRDAIGLGVALIEEMGGPDVESETARPGNGHAGADRPQLANGQAPKPAQRAKHDPADAAARASAGPVVADQPAAPVFCTAAECGAALTPAEIKASAKHSFGPFCIVHGREALTALKEAADKVATGAPVAA